ncbi:MAG TPA: LacI family DNA-binding transcriptional regulator [Armatimonadota bacterium]|jgi:LacI family transcriptional regulator
MISNHRVTQSDIAKEAGVSRTAVSVVLAGRSEPVIAQHTRERILATAARLGYSPRFVMSADANATKNLGFITRDVEADGNPDIYYRRMFDGASRIAQASNYHLLLSFYQGDLALPDLVLQRKVDGLIIGDALRCSPEWIERVQRQVPLVLLNTYADDMEIDAVMPDLSGGMRKAVEHLVMLGHGRLALFGVVEPHPQDRLFVERIAGFHAALTKFALPDDPAYILLPPPVERTFAEIDACARQALRQWAALPAPPTAVLCLNDLFACRLLGVAKELGIRVPEQLSVVGFDGVPFAEHVIPALTTIEQPYADMGQTATRLLLERLEGLERPALQVRVQLTLLVRDSTGPAPVTDLASALRPALVTA